MRVPTEAAEQSLLVAILRRAGLECFPVPNGGYRDIRTASKMKSLGSLRGVPDLHMIDLLPDGRHVWIEMKRRSGGTLSESQKEIHKVLRERGDVVIVAKGCDDALSQLRQHGYTINAQDTIPF